MKNRATGLIWGLVFIFAGVGFAGNAFGIWDFDLFFDGWWTLFIIVPCVVSLFEAGPRTGPVVGIAAGVLLLLSSQGILPRHLMAKLLLPVIFVSIGLCILFRHVFRRSFQPLHFRGAEAPRAGGGDFTAIFGGREERVTGVFEGGDVTGVFGAVTLDLRDAVIARDITVNVTAVFGGVDIRVPKNVHVRLNATPILGGVDNKLEDNNAPAGAPTVFINAVCAFGGIEIK